MIIQSPLLGHLSGTTGNLIAQTYHGKTHIRTKPISYHYPATEEQQKTQARFYDIQRQWQPIYNIISPFYTASQRKGKNIFNLLSEGVYKAAETYPETTPPPAPRQFGSEKNLSLIINPTLGKIVTTDKLIIFDGKYNITARNKKVSRKYLLTLFFNVAQQTMMLSIEENPSQAIHIEISNTYKWQVEEKLHVYCAIVTSNIVSNFFKFI